MYTKRNKAPKNWPIPRKGTKFVAVPTHNQKTSIPLVIVAREMLKVVQTAKELKKLINEKQIKINGKDVKSINYPINLFDTLSLKDSKKHYRAILSSTKKFSFIEVPEKETLTKTYKIIGKKILPGKKVQLNLMEGFNVITTEKAKVGDSVILSFKDNKIQKVIPIEKGKNVYVFAGKHIGNKGKVNEIISKGDKSIALVKTENKEEVNVWVKNLIAIE